MTDDILSGAARALRDEAKGEPAAADATRMRILGSVRAARRRRVLAVRASVALLAAAIGGTAWAAVTGRLPPLPALMHLLGDVSDTDGAPPPAASSAIGARPGPLAKAADSTAADSDSGDSPVADSPVADSPVADPPVVQAPVADSPVADSPVVQSPAAETPRAAASAGAASGGASSASATSAPLASAAPKDVPPAAAPASTAQASAAASGSAVSEADAAADALYQRAHALHFQAHDYAGARAAWEAYIAAAPGGRFAAFAHYNRALCLVRLGRTAEAKRALQAFASGAWGGYRKAEAQSLIDAMEAKQP